MPKIAFHPYLELAARTEAEISPRRAIKPLLMQRGFRERGRKRARASKRERLAREVPRFRGGLVFKAHRHVYHSTLDWIAIKKKSYPGGLGTHKTVKAIL